MGWQEALHIVRFLLKDGLLQIWIPLPAERDVWQL
jgi:hypothetical protein